jgi:arylformamidase
MEKVEVFVRIIDISQEILSCSIYSGDPAPKAEKLKSMEQGEKYNLSVFSMCAHNGTHIDAPSHFIKDGKSIDKICCDSTVGYCYVAENSGDMTAGDASLVLEKAIAQGAGERILIAGDVTVTEEAAEVFAKAGLKLLGNEGQTVGPKDAPMKVHQILLGAETVLLEGIVLKNVSEGKYFLSAIPLNLKGFEGSPCRAYLIEE